MADFLLEIGLDEIPARMIAQAEAELGRRITDLLTRERLILPGGEVKTYSTPRRLAVVVRDVLAAQEDTEEQLTGPSWKVAFKDGAPTAAAEAFAKKAGVAVSALEKVVNPKGEYVGATVKRQGLAAPQVLLAEAPKEVLALYWAKNMYWRQGKPERFVRPVRWVVALLGGEVIPVEIAGITASNASRGHRILHGEAPVVIDQPANYSKKLLEAFVEADAAARREKIRKALDAATRTVDGARWREDAELLETVVHLTEWPAVILGNFEAEYLVLPEEVLVTVMRDHQKYFAVEGADGRLLPHFLAVLNIQVDEEGYATIRHGNQKVLRARFKDARFFWDFDQKMPLAERLESLKKVTFFRPPKGEPWSYHWKTEQNISAARRLSSKVKSQGIAFDEGLLLKAVELAKTDLTTELVKEFTELQGIIGGVYSAAQGFDPVIGKAIYSQYMPASIEDSIPTTLEGQLLGLADRIQTIVSMFGIGMAPTGSKDPFALRRAANAIIKILAESVLPLTLRDVLESYTSEVRTFDPFGDGTSIAHGGPAIAQSLVKDVETDSNLHVVSSFLLERLTFYLKDVRGFAYDVVNAVLAAGAEDVRDAIARAEALTAVRGSEDFRQVSAAFKRIKNILRQADEKKIAKGPADEAVLAPEAKALSAAADALAQREAAQREAGNYAEALALIATLRPTVDAFFDKVMVLDADEKIRGANLAFIDRVLSGFSTIADFSEIVAG